MGLSVCRFTPHIERVSHDFARKLIDSTICQARHLQCTQFATRENSLHLKKEQGGQAFVVTGPSYADPRSGSFPANTVPAAALTGCVPSDDAEDVGSTADRPPFKSIGDQIVTELNVTF